MKYPNLLHRTARIASVLALAAGAPAFLSAALTVAPETPITDLPPGATLNLVAQQDGAPAAGALEWVLHENGNLVPNDGENPLVHTASPNVVSFRPAVAGRSRTFTFQVRLGDQVSAPLTLRVVGATAAAGAGPATGPGAVAKVMPGLPRDLAALAASFDLGTFKGISREWQALAGEVAGTATFKGDLTDTEFLAYTRRHPRLRRIVFDAPGRLTPEGISAGLAQLPELEALATTERALAITDPVLVAIGSRLKELDLGSKVQAGLTDTGLRACTGLRSLKLSGANRVTGAGLPASLQRLAITGCPAFDSANLSPLPALSHLEVRNCKGFRFFAIGRELRSLTLARTAIAPGELSAMLTGNTTLTALDVAMDFPEGGLRPLPLQLEDLALRHSGDRPWVHCDFTQCPELRKLTLWNYAGKVDGVLPSSLRELSVADCPNFSGTVPGQVKSLRVDNCHAFSAHGLPPGILRLESRRCMRIGRFSGVLEKLPGLLDVWFDCGVFIPGEEAMVAAVCASHPSLQKASVYGSLSNELPLIEWERRGDGSGSSSSSTYFSRSSSSASALDSAADEPEPPCRIS